MTSIQLDLAIPNFLIQEFLIDHPPEVERLFSKPFTWLPGGWVEPPTIPGLGIELDWDAIRKHEQLPTHAFFSLRYGTSTDLSPIGSTARQSRRC